MARQIIILETTKAGDGVTNVNCVFWLPVTNVASRVPNAPFTSAAAGLQGAAAITTAEQTALNDGSTREEVQNIQFAASTTAAQIKADLIRRFNDRAAAVAAEPPTRQYYGVSYDGATWSA